MSSKHQTHVTETLATLRELRHLAAMLEHQTGLDIPATEARKLCAQVRGFTAQVRAAAMLRKRRSKLVRELAAIRKARQRTGMPTLKRKRPQETPEVLSVATHVLP